MPIYEFRCLKCDHIFDIFIQDSDEKIELICPECKGESIKRIISKTNYAMGLSRGASKPKLTTKSCGSGNECMTMEIPGYGD